MWYPRTVHFCTLLLHIHKNRRKFNNLRANARLSSAYTFFQSTMTLEFMLYKIKLLSLLIDTHRYISYQLFDNAPLLPNCVHALSLTRFPEARFRRPFVAMTGPWIRGRACSCCHGNRWRPRTTRVGIPRCTSRRDFL